MGSDEPLWNGLTPEQITDGWLLPLADKDEYKRPFFLKHAPRGSREDPGNLDLLLPYLSLSDIVSMDVYPVPEENGFSLMEGVQGLATVGAHAQWLADSMRSLAHDGAEVMVLQAAGLGRIPDQRWEMAEFWQDIPAESVGDLRFVASGDFDADGRDEVAICFAEQQEGGLSVYDFHDAPFGGSVAWHPLTAVFSLDATRVVGTAGDLDGDGDDDLILFLDHGTGRRGTLGSFTQGSLCRSGPAVEHG